jgi:2-dehydro-3-deoxygluconokinase
VETTNAPDIAVVGLSCVDVVATAADCRWHVMNPVSDVRISGGGLGNALLALSGLGLRVGAATRIGKDFYGDHLVRLWESLEVDCRAVTRDPVLPTGLAFVVDHGTERTPFFSAGANRAFCKSDVPAGWCQSSKCVLIFFAGALPSLDGPGMLDLVGSCRRAGTPVILDVSDSTAADYGAVLSYLPSVNLVVNAEEGLRLTGKGDSLAAVRAFADKAGTAPLEGSLLAVTRADGVAVAARAGGGWVFADIASPFHGRPVKSSVGAGDAFRAGLAAYICAHGRDRDAGKFDYRTACLQACATAFLYLNRNTDTRPPFSMADVVEQLYST